MGTNKTKMDEQNFAKLDKILNAPAIPEDIVEVLRHLALCHTVICDPNTGAYSASSPDEMALV